MYVAVQLVFLVHLTQSFGSLQEGYLIGTGTGATTDMRERVPSITNKDFLHEGYQLEKATVPGTLHEGN